MQQISVSEKSLVLWRIRLIIVAFLCALLTSMFSKMFTPLWYILTGVWLLAFLFFYCFYYPVKFKKLSLRVSDDGKIYLKSGVIYNIEQYIEIGRVQYVKTLRSPLQHFLNLKSFLVCTAGGRLFVPCLDPDNANAFLKFLREGE